MKNRIEIPISKSKTIWLLVGSLIFVLICTGMLISKDTVLYQKIIGIIGILFFGLGLVVFPQRLLDKTPGIVIDKDGITDNMTKPRVGTIRWGDISHVEITKIYSTKMLLIFVHNPAKYLKKVEGFNSRGLKNNLKLVGTPFCIPASILKMRLEDVEVIINRYIAGEGKTV